MGAFRQRFRLRLAGLAAAFAVLVQPHLLAQCPPGTVGDLGGFLAKLGQEAAKEEAAQQQSDKPLTSPASRQVTASAKGGNTTTLVNGASFPELLGVAFENGLAKVSDGVTTLDLNPFGFKALFSPNVLDKESDYRKFDSWRKWGGSLSFGGKGESFDRTGDGVADPALDAKNPADIVNWEARYRFLGSRDRREGSAEISAAAKNGLDTISAIFAKLVSDSANEIAAAELPGHPGCFDAGKLARLAEEPKFAGQLRQLVKEDAALQKDLDQTAAKIDESWVGTFAVGGLDRRKQFGTTKRTASLRFAKGVNGQDLTTNLDYSRDKSLTGSNIEESWKLGLAYSILVLKNVNKDGCKLSLSANDELYRNVTAAAHDSIIKANATLEIPLTKGVNFPISVTWANHKDLLNSNREVVGHIGISIDLPSKKSSDQ